MRLAIDKPYAPTTYVRIKVTTGLRRSELAPEDKFIPGVYIVEITDVPPDATSIEIQDLALDHFHQKIAIAELDDFEIFSDILSVGDSRLSKHELGVRFRREPT